MSNKYSTVKAETYTKVSNKNGKSSTTLTSLGTNVDENGNKLTIYRYIDNGEPYLIFHAPSQGFINITNGNNAKTIYLDKDPNNYKYYVDLLSSISKNYGPIPDGYPEVVVYPKELKSKKMLSGGNVSEQRLSYKYFRPKTYLKELELKNKIAINDFRVPRNWTDPNIYKAAVPIIGIGGLGLGLGLEGNSESYKQGGSIHIKEKNKGKFTESAKRAGKSVQEHARDIVNDPKATKLQKRRAQFALNAKKFKHLEGGILDKEKNNKDAVMIIASPPDTDGSFVSIKEVYKYKDGPWLKRILGEYEPGENFQRAIIHRYNLPNDTIITTTAGKAHSLYFGPNMKQRRTANFDVINKLFIDAFNNAGYEMEWGSNPKPRFKPKKISKIGVQEPIEIQVEQVKYDKKGGTINYTKLF